MAPLPGSHLGPHGRALWKLTAPWTHRTRPPRLGKRAAFSTSFHRAFPITNHPRKTPKGPKIALGNPDRPGLCAATSGCSRASPPSCRCQSTEGMKPVFTGKNQVIASASCLWETRIDPFLSDGPLSLGQPSGFMAGFLVGSQITVRFLNTVDPEFRESVQNLTGGCAELDSRSDDARDIPCAMGLTFTWFLTQMCARFSPSRSAAPWEEGADALVPANQRCSRLSLSRRPPARAPLLVEGLLGGSRSHRKVLRRWHLQGDEP